MSYKETINLPQTDFPMKANLDRLELAMQKKWHEIGLYALIRAHLEAEDDIYLSLLDQHLSESQVGVIVENLGRIARAAGDQVG